MGQFTQIQETEIIKTARDLTITIESEKKELKRLKAEKFRRRPTPPDKITLPKPKAISPQYPKKPETTYRYSDFIKEKISTIKKNIIPFGITLVIILVLSVIVGPFIIIGAILSLCMIAFWPLLIVSYVLYRSRKKEIDNQLANSPEYLQAIDDAKKAAEEQQKRAAEEIRLKQAKFDSKHEQQMEEYKNIILPEYERDLNAWSTNQKNKIAIIEEALQLNINTLNELYEKTKLVSVTYRELWILSWLYDDMSSSDHDIRYATELLDRNRQRLATKESAQITHNCMGMMRQTLESGFNAIYNAVEDGNQLQLETVKSLSKTRRDINIGNVIGTVQRHNTNKLLNELLPKSH